MHTCVILPAYFIQIIGTPETAHPTQLISKENMNDEYEASNVGSERLSTGPAAVLVMACVLVAGVIVVSVLVMKCRRHSSVHVGDRWRWSEDVDIGNARKEGNETI